jgi:hypothetical protein
METKINRNHLTKELGEVKAKLHELQSDMHTIVNTLPCVRIKQGVTDNETIRNILKRINGIEKSIQAIIEEPYEW